jgi:hypothetical protein
MLFDILHLDKFENVLTCVTHLFDQTNYDQANYFAFIMPSNHDTHINLPHTPHGRFCSPRGQNHLCSSYFIRSIRYKEVVVRYEVGVRYKVAK